MRPFCHDIICRMDGKRKKSILDDLFDVGDGTLCWTLLAVVIAFILALIAS